jgi:hypothetical protein
MLNSFDLYIKNLIHHMPSIHYQRTHHPSGAKFKREGFFGISKIRDAAMACFLVGLMTSLHVYTPTS